MRMMLQDMASFLPPYLLHSVVLCKIWSYLDRRVRLGKVDFDERQVVLAEVAVDLRDRKKDAGHEAEEDLGHEDEAHIDVQRLACCCV